MRYISTRGQAPALSFEQAMLTGLARDGGLYVPDGADPDTGEIAALAGLSYEDALSASCGLSSATASPRRIRAAIANAYAVSATLRARRLCNWPKSLSAGTVPRPHLAFKDFAMQLIGQLFQTALSASGDRITIVGATIGDTGSAAIEAFRGLSNVMSSSSTRMAGVSEVQRRQMTTPIEANVHALALDGDFDDCQAHAEGHVQRF